MGVYNIYDSMAHCVCLFTIRSIELHALHLNRVLVLFSSETVNDLGVGGRHLAMSLKASATYLNWIMHLRAAACLHCHCTDNWPAKHRVAISHVAEVKTQTGNSCTLLHHWAGLNMTTLPLCWVYLERILFLGWPLPFSTGGLRRTDGRTDKNCQTITVTLRLCFAARVN